MRAKTARPARCAYPISRYAKDEERRERELDGIGRLDGKIKTGNAILYYDAENSRDGHKVRNSEEEQRKGRGRGRSLA